VKHREKKCAARRAVRSFKQTAWIRQAIQIFQTRAGKAQSVPESASYFIQVNTEDFVEDRLLKDCQDDGAFDTFRKTVKKRYGRFSFRGPDRKTLVDFCQMDLSKRCRSVRDLYNLARREMDELAKASGGRNFLASSLPDARRRVWRRCHKRSARNTAWVTIHEQSTRW